MQRTTSINLIGEILKRNLVSFQDISHKGNVLNGTMESIVGPLKEMILRLGNFRPSDKTEDQRRN
jgi:hypothetical protein